MGKVPALPGWDVLGGAGSATVHPAIAQAGHLDLPSGMCCPTRIPVRQRVFCILGVYVILLVCVLIVPAESFLFRIPETGYRQVKIPAI